MNRVASHPPFGFLSSFFFFFYLSAFYGNFISAGKDTVYLT